MTRRGERNRRRHRSGQSCRRRCAGLLPLLCPPPWQHRAARQAWATEHASRHAPLLAAPQRRLRHGPAAPAGRHPRGRLPLQPGARSPPQTAAAWAGRGPSRGACPRAQGAGRAERLVPDTAPRRPSHRLAGAPPADAPARPWCPAPSPRPRRLTTRSGCQVPGIAPVRRPSLLRPLCLCGRRSALPRTSTRQASYPPRTRPRRRPVRLRR